MLSTCTLLLALTALASSQSAVGTDDIPAFPTTVDTAQIAKASADLFNYESSVFNGPAFTSAVNAITSAIPSSLASDFSADPTDFIASVLEATPAPDWFSKIPSSQLAYFSSIENGIVSVATKDVGGAAVTGGALASGSTPSPTAGTSSTPSSGTGHTAQSQSANAGVQGSPIYGAGLLGAFGAAIAGALL